MNEHTQTATCTVKQPCLSGTVNIHTDEVINAHILGGGVNVAFSDYVYYDFVHGGGFNLNLPYSPDPAEEERLWDEYFHMIDYMGMRYVRLQVSYTQWEPINDNDDPFDTDFDKGFIFSPHFRERPEAADVPENTYRYMERLYRLLDHFEKTGVYVILGNWSGGQSAEGFCPDGKGWLKPEGETITRHGLFVKDLDEFAESFAAIMYHLLVEKGYTCVKGFSIYNEPENFDNYENTLVEAYRACAAQLTRLGIRDRVLIQAVDGSLIWNKENGYGDACLARMLERCGDCMDILSCHHYASTIEAGEIGGRIQGTVHALLADQYVKPAVRLAGERPVVLGEMGTFAYAPLGEQVEHARKTFRVPLCNAEAVTAILNAGAKGYGLWIYNTICHPHFTMLDIDPDNPYRLIPDAVNYYPTALTIKYLPDGTDIVKTTVDGGTLDAVPRVFATAGVKGDASTLLLVNDSEIPANIVVYGLTQGAAYHVWYAGEGKTDGVYADGVRRFSEGDTVHLRANSITVLTTYDYGSQTVNEYESERMAHNG